MLADINGIRFHYEVSGSGDPIFLIAGFGANAGFWDSALPLLERFTVVRFDNRGVGTTEYSGEFSIDDMADDIVALMDHLGYRSAHVLGWSMGSQIGQSLGSRYPDRVRSLTLVSTYLRRPSRANYILHTFSSMALDGTAPVECLAVAVNAFCIPETVFRKFEDQGRMFPTPKEHADPQGLVHQVTAVGGLDTTDLARAIKVPTMVIHGDKDIMVEPEDGKKAADAIGGSRFLLLEGAGHNIQFSRYAEDFKAFVREHSRVTSARLRF